MAAPRFTVRSLVQLSLILLFIAAIGLPLAVKLFDLKLPGQLEEKRQMATRPKFTLDWKSLASFPHQFDAYYQDQFPLRTQLVRWHNLAKVEWLGVSLLSSVILGKEGWLYYANNPLKEEHKGLLNFTPDELERWRCCLEERRDWLAVHGSEFLFVVVSSKNSIYPEYLPDENDHLGPQWLDQLLSYLRDHSDLKILDLRPCLREAKSRERVYYRTDVHWNQRGAFTGYQEIMKRLVGIFPGLKAQTRNDFREVSVDVPGGDLATMLNLKDRMHDPEIALEPRRPVHAHPANLEVDPERMKTPKNVWPFATECDDASLPTAVMFRDSFTVSLVPFLSEHFRRIAYYWQPLFDPAVIEKEHPEVVLQEIYELWLTQNLAANSPEVREARGGAQLLREFKASSDVRLALHGDRTGGVVPLNQVTFKSTPEGLVMHSLGTDPYLWLPEFPFSPDKNLILRIELTSPANTLLQLFYATKTDPLFGAEHCITRTIRKGHNVLLMKLTEPVLAGKMRLDPGATEGDYVLHDQEIRGVVR